MFDKNLLSLLLANVNNEPKVGIKVYFIYYPLPKSLVFTRVKISFLVSSLFGALVDPFQSLFTIYSYYSCFKRAVFNQN